MLNLVTWRRLNFAHYSWSQAESRPTTHSPVLLVLTFFLPSCNVTICGYTLRSNNIYSTVRDSRQGNRIPLTPTLGNNFLLPVDHVKA